MKMITLMTLCFMASTHPIFMIITMILMALILNMYMYSFMKYTWFILIITLLILGGLLVIFLYVTSLTPNKKFKFKKKIFFLIPITFLLNTNQITNNSSNNQIDILFMTESMKMLILTLIYLILTLISITMLIKSSMAPIKSNN
uniref:NADH dehydrogenase subunit 6 n=1 Tax=Alectorobius rietcorreai TaxID=1905324 RepID=UPI0022370883|nr:NADH dehydrogenase subunit 6 [Alectorobius rietcorreai]UYB78571.1 NADH dehydrogenase subunit 6 [Alectorobius rietcorreai]